VSATEILEALRRMPPAQRRELVDQIEVEFAGELTAEQVVKLERRAEELRKNPKSGIPWEQVRAEARQRLKSRRAA
jgi:putative addiction module component (TIGR02574 family)